MGTLSRDLDLVSTKPKVELIGYRTLLYLNFKILDYLFFELSCLHTDRQTPRHTKRQTDNGDEHSILYTLYTTSMTKFQIQNNV